MLSVTGAMAFSVVFVVITALFRYSFQRFVSFTLRVAQLLKIQVIYFSQWMIMNTWIIKKLAAKVDHTPNPVQYPRISRNTLSMKTEYDVVVVGSGYGGGTAACRMARADKSVCVLERGLERWPGEYPHTFKTAMREYRVSGKAIGKSFSVGKKTSLYHTFKGEGQDVFLGCGLGGTSLINAGVFLRADDGIMGSEMWPSELRNQPEVLKEYYTHAEHMLEPRSYPYSHATPTKLATFEEQIQNSNLKGQIYRPPLTTFFQAGRNHAGVQMQPNTGSGNECTGLNDGSKNSVLVTYLTDAWSRGTEIFCGIHVRYIRKRKEKKGYVIFYEQLEESGPKRSMWVIAKELVFFGAGALGTTEILLRSRTHGLTTSPLLGQRLSGNGDMLAFAYNCKETINSIGCENPQIHQSKKCGPTITACLDMRVNGTGNARDGYVIQDGAIPEALAPVVQGLLESQKGSVKSVSYDTIRGFMSRLKSWILGPYTEDGSIRRTLVFLAMSHDENDGSMTLDNNAAAIAWSGVQTAARSQRITNLLRNMSDALGGIYMEVPSLTVHPLGGAVMSNDGSGLGGAVNHRGQLYTGHGSDVHEGIICVDGSVIPTSLGVNPSAIITALAERCCDLVIKEQALAVNEDAKSSDYIETSQLLQHKHTSDFISTDHRDGIRFTEVMQGYIYIGEDITDFATAERTARAATSGVSLSVTVDAHRKGNRSYLGIASGTLSCGTLSRDPLIITKGVVEFFAPNRYISDGTQLRYRLKISSTEGRNYTLTGVKDLNPAVAFSVRRTWAAMTTMFTTITDSNGILVGRGIIRLSVYDFLSELRTLQPRVDTGLVGNLCSQAKFFKFFAKNVLSYTLLPFQRLRYPSSTSNTISHFKKPSPISINLTADDGTEVPLKMWDASLGVEAKDTPIMLVPGASVNEQIFSLPTVSTNAIEFFTSLGYRCYVPIPRFGSGQAARQGDTVFDARLDVKAAMQYIRRKEQNREIYAIVHCLGSIAMGIALLNGDVQAQWIKGMTCSQVFTDLIFSRDNALKARSELLIKVYRAIAGEWFSCHSAPLSSWFQLILDQVLRLYPVGSRRELCRSTVCHRCDALFGRCWNHANLNRATHDHLGDVFDGTHTNFIAHLSKMGVMPSHHVRTNQPEFKDLNNAENMQRLRGINICFLSGRDNAVWSQQSLKTTYDTLRLAFPEGVYERVVVEGYGHLDSWMGYKACQDVFPRVQHHLESCVRGEPEQTEMLIESGEYVEVSVV